MPLQYTGAGARRYNDYIDEATGRMLEARPGGTYEIRATWDKLPVPPADGHWQAADPVPGASEDASLSQDADTSGDGPSGRRGRSGSSNRSNRGGGSE